MAIATTTAIALALAAAAAGTSYYNTQKTAKNTDNALAGQIRHQGEKQKLADAKVNDQVAKLKASTAEESRQKSLGSYMDTLRQGRGKLEAGLTPNIGSDAFKADSAAAAQNVEAGAQDRAGLMARIDAPTMQRQGEAFGYGNLATDLDLIGREAQGANFLDELRVNRASKRNAGLDALSSFLGGASSGMGAGASAGQMQPSDAGSLTQNNLAFTPGTFSRQPMNYKVRG